MDTIDQLIAKCKAANDSFSHIVEDVPGGSLITSRASIRGKERVFETPLPALLAARLEFAERYHLEQCLRALEAAKEGRALAAHVPGAPPAEEAGERIE